MDALSDGNEVVVASGYCTALARTNLNPAIKLVELELERHKFNVLIDFVLLITLVKTILQFKPQVIHCITIKPILYGGWAAVLAKIWGRHSSVVWTFAGLGKIFEPTIGWKHSFRRSIVANSLRLVSSLTPIQATFENEADMQTFVSKKIVSQANSHCMMGTGLDLEHYTDKNRKPRDPNQPIRFLLASRLIYGKGVRTYLELASLYHSATPRATFKLAGIIEKTNPDAVNIAEIVNAHNKGSIEFIGEVSQEDMPDLLSKTDVFCLPTRLNEGLPRSLLEAAACGIALIAPDQPSMRQIVIPNQTGWLMDVADINNLKQAVDDALSDESKVSAFGKNARSHLELLPVNSNAIWQVFKNIYANGRRRC